MGQCLLEQWRCGRKGMQYSSWTSLCIRSINERNLTENSFSQMRSQSLTLGHTSLLDKKNCYSGEPIHLWTPHEQRTIPVVQTLFQIRTNPRFIWRKFVNVPSNLLTSERILCVKNYIMHGADMTVKT